MSGALRQEQGSQHLSGIGLAVFSPAAFIVGAGLASIAGAGLGSIAGAGLGSIAGAGLVSMAGAGLLPIGRAGLASTGAGLGTAFSCSSKRPDAADTTARAHSRTMARAMLTVAT